MRLAASIERTTFKDKSYFADITKMMNLKLIRQFIITLSGLQISLRRVVKEQHSGFTLVELIIVMLILAVLAAVAIPYYGNYKDKINANTAVTDILHIGVLITQYQTENRDLPSSLNDVGVGAMLDPWGNPYQYLDITKEKGKGKLRKDKSLNPINSDYDLYSMGKDGKSVTPLTAKASHDDIIRARDGQFVGLASDF
jgi:general secretion pathway protein G